MMQFHVEGSTSSRGAVMRWKNVLLCSWCVVTEVRLRYLRMNAASGGVGRCMTKKTGSM